MKKLFLLFVCTMAAGWMFTTQAKTWRVNNATGINADFKTLDAAMAGVAAGDTVYVEGSPDEYSLATINKKVTIIGPGYFLTENLNSSEQSSSATINNTNMYITPAAQGTVIEGMRFFYYYANVKGTIHIGANNVTIRRCNVQNIKFNDNTSASVNITNCIITQCFIDGIITSSNGATSTAGNDRAFSATITNNIFIAYVNTFIDYVYNSLIENNTFAYPGMDRSPCISNASNCTIQNNILGFIGGTGNKTRDNVETQTAMYKTTAASTDGKWQLIESSQPMTAGTNGSQCGAFGGKTPYILSGLSDVPHIYELNAPAAASTASGLKVTVKVKTEK